MLDTLTETENTVKDSFDFAEEIFVGKTFHYLDCCKNALTWNVLE